MAWLWVPHLLTFLSAITRLLFKRVNKPIMYCRYGDDTFAAFNDEDECNEFLSHLNSLYPSLCFTFEKKCNRTLPFLDVMVEKNDCQFVTSMYRKLTFTGYYIRWNFFLPRETEHQSNFHSLSTEL